MAVSPFLDEYFLIHEKVYQKINRAILFASFVASGFLPMIHGCMLEGKEILGLFPLSHAIGMEAFYLTGVIFYITRYPEKYYPEKFDIWVR